jgi:hypothetical protein
LAVTCDLRSDGATCTPTDALPDEDITLVARISDIAGNSASDQVVVTVDSSPWKSRSRAGHRLITRDASIEVTGTVSDSVVSVDVNGVAAEIDSESRFSAIVRFARVNMLAAVGKAANGKTGTDSVDVTRDITLIVRITSPWTRPFRSRT